MELFVECYSEGGLSIPESYTSYLAPISSSKLWNEARVCKDTGKPPEVSCHQFIYMYIHLVCTCSQVHMKGLDLSVIVLYFTLHYYRVKYGTNAENFNFCINQTLSSINHCEEGK